MRLFNRVKKGVTADADKFLEGRTNTVISTGLETFEKAMPEVADFAAGKPIRLIHEADLGPLGKHRFVHTIQLAQAGEEVTLTEQKGNG